MKPPISNNIIEQLLEKPCWVIDFLPHKVTADQSGQFFKVENLLLQSPHINRLYGKFASLLLQLNCYCDFDLFMNDDEVSTFNPKPEQLLDAVNKVQTLKQHLVIVIAATSTMLMLSGDDTHMSVYNANQEMLQLLEKLATAQGLFLWQAQ